MCVTQTHNINISKDTKPIDWHQREDTNKRMPISMTPEVHDQMKAFCRDNELTLSEARSMGVEEGDGDLEESLRTESN